ncbi:MAG: cysteine dioxygenase family protein [Deltaproteobacteria bacterium]|nr:cysteine dioxygenase family protein [Deltaproteobacteria bacterium]
MTPAAIEPAPGEPYGRTLLTADDDHETLIMRWRPGATCAPHDHGDAGGAIHLLEGAFVERRYRHDADGLSLVAVYEHEAPAVVAVEPGCIHDMRSLGPGTSVHRYSPRIAGMRVYDVERRETLVVSDDCGAWVPRDEALIVAREPWPEPP